MLKHVCKKSHHQTIITKHTYLYFLFSDGFHPVYIYGKSYYLLGKGVYAFGSFGLSVCLFVCLSVDNITQKVMNELE